MAVNLVVAITDYDWFQALRTREDWSEVNFWSPGGANFRALQPGELFLFRRHTTYHLFVGGGVFAHAMTFPCSLAWETFGPDNGASDLAQMRARIQRYRDTGPDDRSDFPIGCRILTQAFFKQEEEWLPVPKSWPIHTQTFKRYSTDIEDGQRLWDWAHGAIANPVGGFAETSARFGSRH
jgi:putative restriction endonuclease